MYINITAVVKDKSKRKVKKGLELSSTIITAANSKFFVPLQYLITSIRKFHGDRQKIICFDLGLSINQKAWLKNNKVKVRLAPYPKLITDKYDHWQTWNKAHYIYKCISTNDKLIWVDADCVLCNKIDFIDSVIDSQFTVFADTGAIKYWGHKIGNENMKNKGQLALNKFFPNEYPNAGVIGLNCKRDKYIIKRWLELTKDVGKSSDSYAWYRDKVAFYDQGLLQRTLEELNLTNTVIQDERYNFAATLMISGFENKYDFANCLLTLTNKGIRIAHFLAKDFYFKIKFDAGIIASLRKTFTTVRNFEELTVFQQFTSNHPS